MNVTLINLLLQLKNATNFKKELLSISFNKTSLRILQLLYKEGFVQSFKVEKDRLTISIFLNTLDNISKFKNLKLISTPSKLKTLNISDILRLKEKKNVLFFSTNLGYLTSLDCKKNHVGGNLLFIC